MSINKKLILLIVLMIFSTLLSGCYDRVAVEQLGLAIGLGFDIEKEDNNIKYEHTVERFLFKGDKVIENDTVTIRSHTTYSTINKAQAEIPVKLSLGAEIAYVIGEERAKFGIKDTLDAFTRNQQRKETAVVVVTKQQAKDVLTVPPINNNTISEDIRDIVNVSNTENFFSKENQLHHLLQMHYSEGQNILLPYFEVVNDRVILSGLALFKEDKMIRSVDLKEARFINLLRNEKATSSIGINPEGSIDYYDVACKSTRKVKVSKEDDILNYDITLKLSCELFTDSINNKALTVEDVPEIENVISEYFENELNEEIKKMQDDYGIDWIDISKYAIAKFGRNSGYGSDDAFKNAQINVRVKTKITSLGQREE